MNDAVVRWNGADQASALESMLACCAAHRWAAAMVATRPVDDADKLIATANAIWGVMEEPDWMQAFAAHPRIGGRGARHASAMSLEWSRGEQSSTVLAPDQIITELAEGNAQYEERFGFTYIVCATGKSAEEMLAILQRRLRNDRQTELREAAEQQRQIMQIRLRKWLAA